MHGPQDIKRLNQLGMPADGADQWHVSAHKNQRFFFFNFLSRTAHVMFLKARVQTANNF